jgi:hypothetical protein
MPKDTAEPAPSQGPDNALASMFEFNVTLTLSIGDDALLLADAAPMPGPMLVLSPVTCELEMKISPIDEFRPWSASPVPVPEP